MACVDKMPKVNEESEMEEGEIVDELDDLSDISSEEEFLLRQRLEVLENYNNVLERKKAKQSSIGPGKKHKRDVLCDLSEISATDLDDSHGVKQIIVQRHVKSHSKQKRRRDSHYVDENNIRKKRDSQKKKVSRSRKKLGITVLSESSDESEDEYRNKRKKLADAVIVHRGTDRSSLSARLHKMIHWSEAHINSDTVHKTNDTTVPRNDINLPNEILSPVSSGNDDLICLEDGPITEVSRKEKRQDKMLESIELSTDDDVKIISDIENKEIEQKIKDKTMKPSQEQSDKDSDEDLELLRQHALKSKPAQQIEKSQTQDLEPNKTEHKPLSDDEDSDTAELRIICLKSALLKKAIEMKQKQKMQKKLSQSSTLEDDLLNGDDIFQNNKEDNNTDTESVDMDIGSDTEEKAKDASVEKDKKNNAECPGSNQENDLINCAMNVNPTSKEDELDDDEDLLRAKLLTSLSKNLTNLVNPEVLQTIDEVSNGVNAPQTANKPANAPEAKKFIIKLGESDSEGEHEATKNLTKMHMKLSEQVDFQQKLDLFLKSTRMEVEKAKLPDVVQQPPTPKKPTKFVAKAVNNLPKSEQIEYKNLVKRMAELEKMKQTRQISLNLLNKQHGKDTLKPRNVTIDSQATINNLEEQIAKSRKTIADESAKMLKLKEEATKLSQRYKIAATELRNISTAITLNKKHQRAVQISLSKIRQQHQSLLMSSTSSLHSKQNSRIPHLSHLSNKALSNKIQKDNYPKDEYKNPVAQKTVKVSVVNDLVNESTTNDKPTRLSVQLNVNSNKKVVMIAKNTDVETDKVIHSDAAKDERKLEGNRRLSESDSNISKETENDSNKPPRELEEMETACDRENHRKNISIDDYRSPLDAFGSNTWQADPNAILCPFEVGGQCKDPDCKYLHTPTQQ